MTSGYTNNYVHMHATICMTRGVETVTTCIGIEIYTHGLYKYLAMWEHQQKSCFDWGTTCDNIIIEYNTCHRYSGIGDDFVMA